MKSKEDIWEDVIVRNAGHADETTIYDAMDEWAKQEAEAYEKWLYDSRYTRKSMPFSDLWNLYLESKKQKV